ncbi:hypothetical protein [unidentified bacterial endosymbiont]|uniref:hypothetical protein n=1 Tax=unidentified bacterial endosymbiont TaxID=2355 RepID=UPI00209D31C0|nr:hypothetical protein [unidentified bacterial endosymbiont]
MGNKESRDNDRDSRDYSSNNQPRELAWSTLLDREINRTERQSREMVTVREQASQPRETAWQELRDREINRTENQTRERVSVREPVREAGEDRGNNRESKHDFTNAITPTSEAKQPDEKKTKASTTLESDKNIAKKPVGTEKTSQSSKSDSSSTIKEVPAELGKIPSSSKEASKSSNSQPGWSVLREPVAQPEKKFLQELIDREINRTENSPREMVTIREIAKEPVVTEKTSQLSSKSDSSSTIKEVPEELSKMDTAGNLARTEQEQQKSILELSTPEKIKIANYIVFKVNPDSKRGVRHLLRTFGVEEESLPSEKKPEKIPQISETEMGYAAVKKQSEEIINQAILLEHNRKFEYSNMNVPFNHNISSDKEVPINFLKNQGNEFYVESFETNSDSFVKKTLCDPLARQVLTPITAAVDCAVTKGLLTTGYVGTCVTLNLAEEHEIIHNRDVDLRVSAAAVLKPSDKMQSKDVDTENQHRYMVIAREYRNAPPEKTFLQDLINREINQIENLPGERINVGEIAKEPVVTEKTSQLSSKSNSSSTIKEVPVELSKMDTAGNLARIEKEQQKSILDLSTPEKIKIANYIVFKVNPDSKQGVRHLLRTFGAEEESLPSEKKPEKIPQISETEMGYAAVKKQSEEIINQAILLEHNRKFEYSNMDVPFNHNISSDKEVPINFLKNQGNEFYVESFETNSDSFVKKTLCDPLARQVLTPITAAIDCAVTKGKLTTGYVGTCVTLKLAEEHENIHNRDVDIRVSAEAVLKPSNKIQSKDVNNEKKNIINHLPQEISAFSNNDSRVAGTCTKADSQNQHNEIVPAYSDRDSPKSSRSR